VINIVAGSQYPYLRFLLFDVAGQLVWVLLYGGLGYIFDEQWRAVSATAANVSEITVGAAFAFAILYYGYLWYRRNRATKKRTPPFAHPLPTPAPLSDLTQPLPASAGQRRG